MRYTVNGPARRDFTIIKTFLITGSSGLIGSEAVEYFDRQGHRVIGVDNNMRRNISNLLSILRS